MENRQRILWIDVAKGICMISVIAGHLGVEAISNIVFSYHLTVFFLLSGYMLKNDLNHESLNRKFRKTMTPYFITCAAVMAMDVFNQIVLNKVKTFRSITRVIGVDLLRSYFASGSIKTFGAIELGKRIGAIWYLPATFFAVLIAQVLLKYVADRKKRYLITVPLALLACISARFVWLPFSIQSAFLAAPVLLLGYDWRQSGALDRISVKQFLVCAGIYLAGIVCKVTPFYYVSAKMIDFVFSPVCAICSSICVIYIAQKIANCKPLGWIGRNSIYFLCIHLFEMEVMAKWFRMLLEHLGLPDTLLLRFILEMLFIPLATALLLLCKKAVRAYQKPAVPALPRAEEDPAPELAKAVLIGLMVFGSFTLEERFQTILYSFHMVAFAFYSGYCFRPDRRDSIVSTIRRETGRFLLLYACFGLGYLLLIHNGSRIELESLICGMSAADKLLADVIPIGPAHFVLLLFVTKMLYLLITYFIPDERRKAVAVLGISLLGVWLGKNGFWLPWSADCAMYALVFCYLGHLFRKYSVIAYLHKKNYSYFILSTIWAYMIYTGGMDLTARQYGSYGLTVLGAVSAAVLLYMLCAYLCRVWNPKVTAFLSLNGKSAMCVLLMQTLFFGYISKIVRLRFKSGGVVYVVAIAAILLAMGAVIGQLTAFFGQSTARKAKE